MKKNVFLKRLLLAAMMAAPFGLSAQVTIGSGDLPQATLDIIGDTLTAHGEAFRLIDGNQQAGKVLTCQENGVGTWKEPLLAYTPIPTAVSTITVNTPSINVDSLTSICSIINASTPPLFRTLGCHHFRYNFPLTNTDGTVYSIDFPDYGTYFVSLEVMLSVPDIPLRDIDCNSYPYAILQMRTTPSMLDWSANTPDKRFTGQYEVYSQYGNNMTSANADFRLVMNQMVQVTEQTGLKGYLVAQLVFDSYPDGTENHTNVPLPSAETPMTITAYIGNDANTTFPQVSGGAFVKMAEVMQ